MRYRLGSSRVVVGLLCHCLASITSLRKESLGLGGGHTGKGDKGASGREMYRGKRCALHSHLLAGQGQERNKEEPLGM